MAAPIAELQIEIAANIAKLQTDLKAAQGAVKQFSGEAANQNRVLHESELTTERLAHRFTAASVAIGEFGAGIKSGEALVSSLLRTVEFTAAAFGPWGVAIASVSAAFGALITNLGGFGDKAKESKSSIEAFGAAQDIVAGKMDKLTTSISSQSNALDQYMVKLQDFNAAELVVEGQKLADMQAQFNRLATPSANKFGGTIASRFVESPEGQQMARDIQAQQALVDQISRSAIAMSNNISDAAVASSLVEDSTDGTAKNLGHAASNAKAMRDALAEAQATGLGPMASAIHGNIPFTLPGEDIANPSKGVTSQLKAQAGATHDLVMVNNDLEQSMNGIAESFLNAKDGSVDWSRVTIQAIDAISDAIIKLTSMDTGGKGGLGGLLGSLLSFIPSLFGGIGGGGAPVSGQLGTIPGIMGDGGPVSAGSPYIVGDQGPEMFVPSVAGHIVPNDDLMRSGGGSSFYIDARNATPGVEATIERVLQRRIPGIVKASKSDVLESMRRGGDYKASFAQAIG